MCFGNANVSFFILLEEEFILTKALVYGDKKQDLNKDLYRIVFHFFG